MKVGVLTGGGDCPGLNAVIRAVVRTVANADGETLGLMEGWRGAIEGQHIEFTGEIPALSVAQRKDLAACPLQVDDFVELCFTLPLEVPTEIRCVARAVRLESGHNP